MVFLLIKNKQTNPDVQCDGLGAFEATIVVPKSFVVPPEFNDLAEDERPELVGSRCTISQVKYRLYPTYRLLVRDYRLCGVTSNHGGGGDDDGQSNDHRRRALKLESKHESYSSSFDRANGGEIREHARDENIWPPKTVNGRHVSSTNEEKTARVERVFMLNIRFPVIKSLRTEEDTYATLICSPEQQAQQTSPGRVTLRLAGSENDDDKDENDDDDDNEEELEGDDSIIGGNKDNNLREPVMGDESRRQAQILKSRHLNAESELMIREASSTRHELNDSAVSSSRQVDQIDNVADYRQSSPSSSSLSSTTPDETKNSAGASLMSISPQLTLAGSVAVPASKTIVTMMTSPITDTDTQLHASAMGNVGKLQSLPQPDQKDQPPIAAVKLMDKPTRATTVNSSTNNTSSSIEKEDNHSDDHRQKTILASPPSGRQLGSDDNSARPTSERRKQQQSKSGDKLVNVGAVGLAANKLPSWLSPESHEVLSFRWLHTPTSPVATIRKHVTSMANFNETSRRITNKTTEQMMQTTDDSQSPIIINNTRLVKLNKINHTDDDDDDEEQYDDVDTKYPISKNKTFQGRENHQFNLSLLAFVLSALMIVLMFAIIVELNVR